MIYVFRGCQAACTCTARACGAVCKGISSACTACCKVCDASCECVTAPFSKPFGGYVLWSVALGAPAAACGIMALHTKDAHRCEHIRTASLLQVVFGLGHALFAVYFQQRLLAGLTAHGELEALGLPEYRPAALAERAWHIILYDVGFCLYVPFFAAAFVVAALALGWSVQCSSGALWTVAASVLLLCYSAVASGYFIKWWVVVSCFGLAETAVTRGATAAYSYSYGAGGSGRAPAAAPAAAPMGGQGGATGVIPGVPPPGASAA